MLYTDNSQTVMRLTVNRNGPTYLRTHYAAAIVDATRKR